MSSCDKTLISFLICFCNSNTRNSCFFENFCLWKISKYLDLFTVFDASFLNLSYMYRNQQYYQFCTRTNLCYYFYKYILIPNLFIYYRVLAYFFKFRYIYFLILFSLASTRQKQKLLVMCDIYRTAVVQTFPTVLPTSKYKS